MLRGNSARALRKRAYCQARKRLPEEFFSQIARQTGCQLDAKAKSGWLWKNRRVHIFDGATVSMPDTYENQQAYPQPPQQKPGLGFPLMRIAVIFSLACGSVLDVGMCRYAGKGQSELALLRQMWSIFRPGDIMLADRLMCAWTELVMLKQRDVDSVCRFNSANRKTDFRRGTRLGKDDHIVTWFKPTKPRSIDRQTYNTLPESLTIRECRVPIAQPGFRVKVVVIATTLLDHIAYPPSELAELYRARWNAELDLRSLKRTMQMDVLRCKTPELVRKELWTHILAYNLIRTIIAQAAHKHDLEPRLLSFKGAIQTLEAFQPVIALQGEYDAAHRLSLYQILLDAIATHRVADRPDRYSRGLGKDITRNSRTCENLALRSNARWPKGLPRFQCHSCAVRRATIRSHAAPPQITEHPQGYQGNRALHGQSLRLFVHRSFDGCGAVASDAVVNDRSRWSPLDTNARPKKNGTF